MPLHYFRFLNKRNIYVHLITHHRNREELENNPEYSTSRIHFTPDTLLHKAVWRIFSRFPDRIRDLIGGGLMSLVDEYYRSRLIGRIIEDYQINLIHQPTPVSPLLPSNLHRFGIPIVIGPMNGGMDYPPGYEDYESPFTRLAIKLGRRAALMLNWLKPGKRYAAALLVANERTRKALPFPNQPRIKELVENGVDFTLWGEEPRPTPRHSKEKLRLLFMGRLVKWKAVDTALQAIAISRSQGIDVTLDILGDGEERAALASLALKLGLTDYVQFHGFKPQSECGAIMAQCDALVLNSLRECGGAVVLEAMAMGIPVVASDWGGPADYIKPECGILVPPCPRDTFADRLAIAFTELARNPDMLSRMGQAGHRIARKDYSWESKIDRILEIYQDALEFDPGHTRPR